MDWTTILILTLGSITTLILFSLFYFGAKNNKRMTELDDSLNLSSTETKQDLNKILKFLDSNKERQDRILDRLQNLETIVTSEAWEAIKEGKDSEHVKLLLQEEEVDEISNEDKAKNIAKRIKH
jgi:hypothetical protein